MNYFPEEEKEGGVIYVILLNEKRRLNIKHDATYFFLCQFLLSNHSDYTNFNVIYFLSCIFTAFNN